MQQARPQDWYRLRSLDQDVTLIDEPFIKPFYRCNVWHVRGRDSDLLVDSGMGVVSLREWVPRVSEKPLMAVASHTHFDHIGSHHEFAERLAHPAEAALLAAPTRQNTLADPYASEEIFTRLPPGGFQATRYAVKAAPATRLIEEGEVLDLGDRHFTVLHLPGHSPGGIALFEKASGILFSGDTVYDGPLVEDCYHSNPDDYLTSMRRLLELPVTVVHGGHFPSFDGKRYRQLIRDWLEAKERA